MNEVFKGLYLLASALCLGASIYQNFLLIKNYFKRDTVYKNEEITFEGNMFTPDLLICRDPPIYNDTESVIQNNKIRLWNSRNGNGFEDLAKFSYEHKKIVTMYKVVLINAMYNFLN